MSGVVIDLLGSKRTYDAHLVRDLSEVREQGTDCLSRLTKLAERVLRSKALKFAALKLGDRLALGEGFRHGFAVHLGKLGLVVQRFQMRRPSRHAEENDAFGFGGLM